ncbi:NAD-dependent epimerase/dehydratase family protein [Streptomyces sp. NPDC048361]|uniref:NAD-dependent epimerase/dehydratase family protein n=1 Tax=Streptomyces sp. NPDC048361 TaxID=3154720 RepID=UPI0034493505
MRDVLVIGGNRYFGKRLITRLLAAGDRVTVLNRGSAPPPPGVVHLIADRDDEPSLAAAIGERTFDAVVDQVCYTPRQAAIARRVFTGRTARYVMTSTVEVYEYEDRAEPVGEDALDAATVIITPELPWHEPEFVAEYYGEGKRQAEAVFATGPPFPHVAVRVAHVLGGADDFTGRLTHYADRIRAGEPVAIAAANRPATYIDVEEIAAFLFWVTRQDFTGPVNAASHGPLVTEDIVAAITGTFDGGHPAVRYQPVEVGAVSPFSFARSYAMDNARAESLGFTFSHTEDWLTRAVTETLGVN